MSKQGRKKSSLESSREAIFNQMGVERFRSEMGRAQSHIIGRERRVVRVFAYLSLMRNAGWIPKNPTCGVEKAGFQHFSAVQGNQAAHYLSGQVLINGQIPSAFLTNNKAIIHFNNLFADVENLPGRYNRADTELEKHSLMKNFLKQMPGNQTSLSASDIVGRAESEIDDPGELGLCYLLLECAAKTVMAPIEHSEAKVSRGLVTRTYEYWDAEQSAAFVRAIDAKTQKMESARTPRTRQRRAEEIICLEAYRQALENPENKQTHRHIALACNDVEKALDAFSDIPSGAPKGYSRY